MKREDGGAIRISSEETDASFTVTIEDNGVGFDADILTASTGDHVGLSNVRSRLEAQCRGSLTIASMPGLGTTVTITIPKELII